MTRLEPPVCVALDVPTLDDARHVMDALSGLIGVFKVGLELFTACGPAAGSYRQHRLALECGSRHRMATRACAGTARRTWRNGAYCRMVGIVHGLFGRCVNVAVPLRSSVRALPASRPDRRRPSASPSARNTPAPSCADAAGEDGSERAGSRSNARSTSARLARSRALRSAEQNRLRISLFSSGFYLVLTSTDIL